MGAGCIIEKGDKILALLTKDGRFDLPKGRQEVVETVWECAQRETYEECGIWFEFNEVRGRLDGDQLTLFVVSHKGQPVRITSNPETNEFEHYGYRWVSPHVFVLQCLPYMIPLIRKYIGVKYAAH